MEMKKGERDLIQVIPEQHLSSLLLLCVCAPIHLLMHACAISINECTCMLWVPWLPSAFMMEERTKEMMRDGRRERRNRRKEDTSQSRTYTQQTSNQPTKPTKPGNSPKEYDKCENKSYEMMSDVDKTRTITKTRRGESGGDESR